MTPQATLHVLEDDIRLYPNHEEDDVPEGTLHQRWSDYLVYSLAARFPHWFVAGNICVYWEPGNTRDYVAPDAFVAGGRVREPPPRVYRTWLLPSLLFAAEIGSVSNTREKIEETRERYEQHVRPLEILETEPLDEEAGEPLRTYEEEQQARLAAEQRWEHEAQERAAAEQRWQHEAQERAAAEERVVEERAQRERLEREVAELRARLAREGS